MSHPAKIKTMPPWATGIQIGPYLLAGPIRSDGMGEVWKARDRRLDRIVAIKRLKGQHSARFEQEARAIAALNHPYVCQIYDVGPDYLVMEYIEGRSPEGSARGSRVEAGGRAAKAKGTRLGRPRRVFRRDEALRPRAEGMSWRNVAQALNLPMSTVIDACRPCSENPPKA
jgi:hypothetical protein